jgi:hypothetical protein
MLRRVALVRTNVSEELSASTITFCELGTLAATLTVIIQGTIAEEEIKGKAVLKTYGGNGGIVPESFTSAVGERSVSRPSRFILG